jgi:transposase-like protein
MSQKWRKYSPEFRQAALERMRSCANVCQLARELGIRRKFLYLWKHQAADRTPGSPPGRAPAAGDAAVGKLRAQVQRLESLTARQRLELDFFRGALQQVAERRRQRERTSAPGSTSRSGRASSCKAN